MLLVFPFSFLSVLVLVLLLLLLFSHLLPISLSLSLSLTYLSASHKAATKASEIATNHGAVLLGRRPPAQPAIAQQTCNESATSAEFSSPGGGELSRRSAGP